MWRDTKLEPTKFKVYLLDKFRTYFWTKSKVTRFKVTRFNIEKQSQNPKFEHNHYLKISSKKSSNFVIPHFELCHFELNYFTNLNDRLELKLKLSGRKLVNKMVRSFQNNPKRNLRHLWYYNKFSRHSFSHNWFLSCYENSISLLQKIFFIQNILLNVLVSFKNSISSASVDRASNVAHEAFHSQVWMQ